MTRRSALGRGAAMGGAALLLAAGPSSAPSLAISPTSGAAGSTVSVSGAGFGRKQMVTLAWNTVQIAMIRTGGNGSFTTSVPAPIVVGSHVFTATSASVFAQALFTTIGSAPPPAPVTDVTAPIPPQPYAIASGALSIATTADLVAALAVTTPRDYVLEDGVYDAGACLSNVNGHRLQARNLLGATIRNGVQPGANWGPGGALFQGIAFDVSNPAHTYAGWGRAILDIWAGQSGSAERTRVYDCTFDGHAVIGAAIWTSWPNSNEVKRVVARNFTSYGVGTYGAQLVTVPIEYEDIDIIDVTRAVPMSANGTAESGLWLGHLGIARRVRCRGCAWMGIWTGNLCNGSLLEDLDIVYPDGRVGIYPEHKTLNTTFRRFNIRTQSPTSQLGRGINCEWYSVFGPGNGSANDCVMEDGTISGGHIGIAWNSGCKRNLAQRVKFVGQTIAAIEDLDDEPTTNRYLSNDYSQIAAGAVAISRTLHNF